MKLLVITSLPDPHVDMVTKHLPTEVKVVVFDPMQFPDKQEISLEWNKRQFEANLLSGSLSDVFAVWYRKPILPLMESMPVPDMYKEMTYSSLKESIIWFYSMFPDKLWVSDYWHIKRAGSKVYQFQVASRLGLSLPDTLITSSEKHAVEFLKRHERAIVKPLNLEFVRTPGQLKATYTSRVSLGQNIAFSGLKLSPVVFQPELSGTNVRVTVIGDKVFPCVIEKTGDLVDQIDWRLGLYTGNINIYPDDAFPSSLSEKCVEMVKKMGLMFGAFDFIRDEKTGIYWFLEINPNGQWGFVELATGIPLSRCMSDLLTSPLR